MPRSRVRGSPFVSLPYVYRDTYQIWSDCSQSAEVLTDQLPMLAYGSYERFSDEVIPNFHSRLQRGEVFFNPMSQIIEKREGNRGVGEVRQFDTPKVPCGNFHRIRYNYSTPEQVLASTLGAVTHPVYVNPIELFSSEDVNDLLVEHSTRVLSTRGREGPDLYESLAQADKAASLLPGLLGNIRKIVPPRNKLPSKIKNLAQAWLGIRYGLMPLIRDVDTVVEGLKKPTGPLRRTTRSNSGDLRRTKYYTATFDAGNIAKTIGVSISDSLSVRVMSLDEYDVTMLNNIGFSGKNLLTLPWELIPYSFVVDWFANIGDFVGSIAPSPGVKQLGTAATLTRTTEMDVTSLSVSAGPGWSNISSGFGNYKPSLYTRNRTTTLPSPRIVLKNDFRFKNLTRVLDATSLLLSKIR